jgi:hypothetical protein
MRAIEVYHSDHTPDHVAMLWGLAKEFKLLATGGSDYHGENKPDVRLGTGRCGNLCLADDLLTALKDCFAGDAQGHEFPPAHHF